VWGGTVTQLHALPEGATLAYATGRLQVGTEQALFRSTDAGRTWARSAPDGVALGPLAVSVDGDVYLAIDDAGSPALLRSRDSGATWTATAAPEGFDPFGGVAASANGHVFAFEWRGWDSPSAVRASADGGATWSLPRPLPPYAFPWRAASVGDTLLVPGGSGGELFRSTDAGETWTTLSFGGATTVEQVRLSDGVLYVVLHNEWDIFAAPYATILRSLDGGARWEETRWGSWDSSPSGVDCDADTCFVAVPSGSGRGAYAFDADGARKLGAVGPGDQPATVLPVGGRLLAADLGGHGVYASDDGGATWARSSAGIDAVHFQSVAVAGGTASALATTWDDGPDESDRLFLAADGAAWTEQEPVGGFDTGAYDGIAALGTGIAVSNWGTVYFRSGSTGWQPWSFGDDGDPYARVLLGTPDRLFASDHRDLFTSADGQTWTRTPLRLGETTPVAPVTGVLDVDGVLLLALGSQSSNPEDGRGVWRSEDDGQTWARALDDPTRPSVGDLAAFSDGTVLAASPRDGKRHPGGLFRSSDGGRSFAAVDGFADVVALASDGDRAYAAYGSVVTGSADTGRTWTPLFDLGEEIRDLAIDGGGDLLVATSDGLFGVAGLRVGSAPGPADRTEAIALTATPNPVRGRATFQVRLSKPGMVEGEVFDGLGRHVATIASAEHPSGLSEISWDTDGIPAGIYVVRFVVASRPASALITVIR